MQDSTASLLVLELALDLVLALVLGVGVQGGTGVAGTYFFCHKLWYLKLSAEILFPILSMMLGKCQSEC